MTNTNTALTILDTLVQQVRSAAQVNPKTHAKPAAILWTDKDCQWQSAMELLKQHLPELVELGEYNPDARIGPAVWVKCAVARKVLELPEEFTPIVYLPGVSRKELRAIELCAEELKPLAELQYRGVWWAAPNNNSDWTVSGFLASKDIGLELDIAKDAKSHNALLQVLPALLEESVDSLCGKRLDASALNKLIASDPMRDVLQWMDNADVVSSWDKTKQSIFHQHCLDHFNLAATDTNRVAYALDLCEQQGEWADVWPRFTELAHRLPNLVELMVGLKPASLASDPQYYLSENLEDEQSLQLSLDGLANRAEDEVRLAISQLFSEHEVRKSWLWYELGYSNYLKMLSALNDVVIHTQKVFSGPDVESMAKTYQQKYWQADGAVLNAMACAKDDSQRHLVAGILAIIYTPWLTRVTENFQGLVQSEGYPGSSGNQINEAHNAYQPGSQVIFFVDGLRFDVAQELVKRLQNKENRDIKLSSNWSAVPSLTATAKAAITPVHDLLTGDYNNDDFIPMLSETDQAFSSHHLRKLLAQRDWQYLEGIETGEPTGKAWVQTGDIDHAGHDEQLRLPGRITDILAEIQARIEGLLVAGWKHIRIVTDHGWLWVPDKLPKAELPKDVVAKRFSRCGILKANVATDRLTLPWHWNDQVRVALAPGISGFVAGDYYNHGGLSLQECLTPVINIHSQD